MSRSFATVHSTSVPGYNCGLAGLGDMPLYELFSDSSEGVSLPV
jgi:hypothetical protein